MGVDPSPPNSYRGEGRFRRTDATGECDTGGVPATKTAQAVLAQDLLIGYG